MKKKLQLLLVCTAALMALIFTTACFGDDVTVMDEAEEANMTVAVEQVSFSTVDLYGNPYTSEDMKNSGATVVMVNFWEPWCGPCVGEMPELEQLYENYADQGLLILGVYSTQEDAESVVEQNQITYPIIRADENLAQLESDYVPTTVFMDADGNLLSATQVIGSNDYETWETMVKSYLGLDGES